MEISVVVMIDGTKYKVDSPAFSGIIKRIFMVEGVPEMEVLVQVTKREKEIHIPYHSVLFYEEKG